ncbi:archease [Candidatus Woesearchaeota archaeon]|nr:archease [Candidatus Woesearchaeota archaeon]
MQLPFHKFLDHTADVFFVAKAASLAELFNECALAVEETMVDITKVKPKQKIKILGEDTKIEGLLFDFLDEMLFYKDAKQLIFSKFEIEIKESTKELAKKFELTCFAYGEKIDMIRHQPRVDVKAITMHEFSVEQVPEGWKAKVLIDI